MKTEKIPSDIITLLDEIKKRLLQIEYLGLDMQLETNIEFLKNKNPLHKMDCTDFQLFYLYLQEVRNTLNALIPEAVRVFLDEQDYTVYTDKYYHRKFWNEIELPEFLNQLFYELRSFLNLEYQDVRTYELSLYDMSEEAFYFLTKEEVVQFANTVNCAPATLRQIITSNGGTYTEELWSI